MKIVNVPYWLIPILKQNHLKYSDLTNYSKLSTILSKQDLQLYLYLSFQATQFFPKELREYIVTINSSDGELFEQFKEHDELNVSLSHPVKSVNDFLHYTSEDFSSTESTYGVDVEILFEEDLTFFVVAKPLERGMSLLSTYRSIVSKCASYLPLESVTKLNLFRDYESLLRFDVQHSANL